jgi:predicted nucleic acid-binding protein
MAWLLDTNILSELRKAKPDPKVVAFVSGTSVKELYVSSVTLAEIRFGIEKATDPNDRVILTHWLTHTVRPMFTGRVLEVTEDIMLEWRLLVEEGRKINHTFSQPDLFIAAIALHHDLTIATRNQKDFDKTRVPIFNPWDA